MPRPHLHFVSPVAVALALALVVPAVHSAPFGSAPFGVEWFAPNFTRIATGSFRWFGARDILAVDHLGVPALLDANTGRVSGTVANTFVASSVTRVQFDLDGDGNEEIVQWASLAGTHTIDVYDWSGSGIVRKWVVTRPGQIQRLEFVSLFGDSRVQIVLLQGTINSGLEVLDSSTGALLYELPPVGSSSATVEFNEWDSSPGLDVLFRRTGAVFSNYLIGAVGVGIGLKWSFAERIVASARIASPDRRDLFVATNQTGLRRYSGDTGADLGPLPATFDYLETAQNQIVDIDGDGTDEVLNNGALFDWNGSAVYERWALTPAQASGILDLALTEIDGDFTSQEVAVRSTLGVVVVDGLTGETRYASQNPPVGLSTSSGWWIGEFDEDLGVNEIMAYFPGSGPTPAKMLLIGFRADTIRTKWLRDSEDVLGVDFYRDFNHLDILERNVFNTQAYLYDGRKGMQVALMPPAFDFSTPFTTQILDLDGDATPDLLHHNPGGGGVNGTRMLEWTGSTIALQWQSSQPYDLPAQFGADDYEGSASRELGILASDRIVILSALFGTQIYDTVNDGFVAITDPVQGSWEGYGPQADILFEGQLHAPPPGLFLLSSTPPLTDAPVASHSDRIELFPAAPNPAHGFTTIAFRLPREANATLKLFDAAGRQVRELASGHRLAGSHRVSWDGRDGEGRSVAAGVYWSTLAADGRVLTQRLVVLP